jgi:hypothetical protein
MTRLNEGTGNSPSHHTDRLQAARNCCTHDKSLSDSALSKIQGFMFHNEMASYRMSAEVFT